MTTIRAPLSLSINEEVGLLVEGFDTPPCVMMPHHRAYQGHLAEATGLTKVKDLLAWSYRVAPPTPRSDKALKTVNALPEVRFRSIDKRRLPEEVETALRIFNDAWHHNWGFVPATPGEAAKMARDLRLLIDSTIAFFAEIEGRARSWRAAHAGKPPEAHLAPCPRRCSPRSPGGGLVSARPAVPCAWTRPMAPRFSRSLNP